ncbi:DNA polymerase II protein, partial [human gut metagenome]
WRISSPAEPWQYSSLVFYWIFSVAQAGFILPRHWRDTPQGTEVSFWLATDNGPLQVTLAPQESVAFIPADQVPRAQHILQ